MARSLPSHELIVACAQCTGIHLYTHARSHTISVYKYRMLDELSEDYHSFALLCLVTPSFRVHFVFNP